MNRFESDLERLRSVVARATSISEILRVYDYSISSGSYRVLKRTLAKHAIEYSHIKSGLNASKGRVFVKQRVDINAYFVEASKRSGSHLKSIILRENLKPYECVICRNSGLWFEQPLVLQLDHINGNSTDNRLSNLRFLCPNCHSQTETFCGRKKKAHCVECG